ncbi:MAG: ISNCY family transposase, partial [Alphaproteobacteria bacterium]|nr:ISNCY family transposase [Alphaproteobacteria bacterium]
NNGYNLEHNFGHGKKHLAVMFAAMNMLAFAMHTLCDSVESPWIKARNAAGKRKRFFDAIRILTTYTVFPDWWALMTTIASGRPP